MKYILHIIAIAALAYGWNHQFQNKALVAEAKKIADQISGDNLMSDHIPEKLNEATGMSKEIWQKISDKVGDKETDPDETMAVAKEISESIDSSSTFMGMFMAFLSAGYGGLVFVAYALPALAQRATHSVFDSGATAEKDAMAEARSKAAQGDYEGAVEAYRVAAEKEPENRMPWVEIIKIQRDSLQQPQAAIDSIREALEKHAWPEIDTAYFLFRLADLYHNDTQDLESAGSVLKQVLELFPETRHSANARNKLQEWGIS